MKPIPEDYLDLLEGKAFGHLATLMPDGSPQVSPLWVAYDGRYILLNSEKGRQKDRNMRRDSRIAIEISDPENPYRYLLVRGRVVEITEEGAEECIHQMAIRYTGKRFHELSNTQPRVIYKVLPEFVKAAG